MSSKHEVRIPQVPQNQSTYRLRNLSVWSGTQDGVATGQEIEVAAGRIAYVGADRGDIDPETPSFNLGGYYATPGFIDTHVHLMMSIEEPAAAMIAKFPSEVYFGAAQIARRTLEAGITTARDLGGLDAGFRQAIAKGLISGPRLHLAVGVISPTGGHADMHLPNGASALPESFGSLMRLVNTDDDMRVAVRELIRSGADVIKICTTGGVSSPTDTPDHLGVPESQIAIAIEEVGKRDGQPIAAHAQGAAGVNIALKGGVTSVEHGYEIDETGIGLLAENGSWLVPTLTSALRVPDPKKVAPYLYAKKVKWSQIARTHVSRAIQAGARVAMGTDAGVCPHGVNLTELGHMVDLGMSPDDALRAGTINAAMLMRLDDQLGTLEPGKFADLVLTQKHPLDEIHELADPAHVTAVIQGGNVVKNLGVSLPE